MGVGSALVRNDWDWFVLTSLLHRIQGCYNYWASVAVCDVSTVEGLFTLREYLTFSWIFSTPLYWWRSMQPFEMRTRGIEKTAFSILCNVRHFRQIGESSRPKQYRYARYRSQPTAWSISKYPLWFYDFSGLFRLVQHPLPFSDSFTPTGRGFSGKISTIVKTFSFSR